MAEEVATFSLRIDADADPVAESAEALERYKAAIDKSKDAIASYSKSLGLLKGKSAEVTDAKTKLKAAIELERAKATQANLGILKLGGSYDKLTKSVKKAADAENKAKGQHDAQKKALSSIGGPAKDLMGRFEELKGILPALSNPWTALAVAVAASVAVWAVAAAGVADLTAKFTEWLVKTADANRNLQLTREAFSGTTKNATAWGHVLDWASEKTALTTAELNELIIANEKTFRGFRISGQGMVDAFKATAAAAGAGRQDVADFFKEILERGKQTGRTFVQFADFAKFRNAGIDVNALYKELGITAAQAARGAVVSTDKMAAALRKVSENRFAELNGKKMLSLGAQWARFQDNLMRFTNDLAGEGGALEPLLKAIKQVVDLFDLSTQSGQDMKASITQYGKALSGAIVAHLPDIKAFVLNAMELAKQFIVGAAAVFQWTQSAEGMADIKAVFEALVDVGKFVIQTIKTGALVTQELVRAFEAVGSAISAIGDVFNSVTVGWEKIGTAIVEGIKSGLTAAWDGLKNAVGSMADGIKDKFKSLLGIASPSKVFANYGKMTGVGYAQGVQQSGPVVSSATSAMADDAVSAAGAAGAAPGGGAGGSSRTTTIGTIENHFIIQAKGGDAEGIKEALSSRSFLDGFESSLKILLQSQGIPTGGPVPSGG